MIRRILRRIYIIHLFSLIPLFISGQSLQPLVNKAFKRGELLTFEAYYDSYITGKVKAGQAVLEVQFQEQTTEGRKVYHITGEGKSSTAFSLFFHVRDRFESFIDEEYLVPWYFIRRTHEGGYRYHDDVRFNQFSGTYSSTRRNGKMPIGTHDIVSAFYYARNLDFSNLTPGDTYPITFLLDDSVYTSVIRFIGRDLVSIDLGVFRCLHFKPMVVTGNVFSQPYPMDIWITDDPNHIPVLAKSGVIVGSVKMELIEYRGLSHPLLSQVKN